MSTKNRLRVLTSDLEVGMYVSELDRPWLDTPFVVQGFTITSEAEVEELEKHCRFVYVDVDRSAQRGLKRSSRQVGTRGDLRSIISRIDRDESIPLKFRPRLEDVGKLLFPHRKILKYEDAHDLEQELPFAKTAFNELSRAMESLITDYDGTGRFDAKPLNDLAKPLIDSIVRNPDACVWLARIKGKESYSHKHAVACAVWALALGRQLGVPVIDLTKLATGALLFDIGKLRVPAELLTKQGKLNKAEHELIRSHVQFGLEMLDESGIRLKPVVEIMESHHERHAGHGYPKGLKEEQIPVLARIAGLVDCYDAITSIRPFGKPMSPSLAVKKLFAWRDVDFQAEIVEEFVQAVGIYPAGTLVELSSGQVAMVMADYRTRRLKPQVVLLLDRDKKPVKDREVIDLRKASDGDAPIEIIQSLEPGAYGLDPEQIQA